MLAEQAASDYVTAEAFGAKTSYYMATSRTIVMALVTIIYGGPVGWVSGALTLASVGAALAGDENLSENLGWAAFGVGVAGTVYGMYQAAQGSNQGPSGQEKQPLPAELQEAGISIDESFPTAQHNNIVNGLSELFRTDIGKQLLDDIRENTQGVDIRPGEELATYAAFESGKGLRQAIEVHSKGASGMGRGQFVRGLFYPADEFRSVVASGVGKTKIWALYLGHEFGHAVYNYSDHAPPLNLIRIENPLRSQLGINTMRVHYKGALVLP